MKKKTTNYYRRITESLPHGRNLAPHMIGYTSLFMGIAAVLLTLYLLSLLVKFEAVREKRLQALDNLRYWESVVRRHPNFTEGYYKAGYYSYVLGMRVKAIEYLDSALVLDPAFTEAHTLAGLIRK